MIEAISCGGIVIYHGKILLLYKNYKNRYCGWVLPRGTVEEGEEFAQTAVREVKEETGVDAQIIKRPLVFNEIQQFLLETSKGGTFPRCRLL